MEQFSLSGKVAIVTGASRGIGEAIARIFGQAGAKLILASRKQEGLDAVAAAIRGAGSEVATIAAHMGEQDAARAVVQHAISVYGGVDIVVNNAGTNPHFGPLLTSEESMWDKTFDVNLRGYFRLIREATPSMAARGGGKVVNIASVAGLAPQPGMGLYCITKAGDIMLTKVLAVELAAHNIQVNAICPGFIKTRFSQAIWGNPQLNDAVIASTPAKRMGTVDEIAAAALYLASPASDFITGQALTVDGGQTIASGV